MRPLDWIIIDGIGPFFRDCDHKRINWSKIPFEHVESRGMLEGARADQLVADFRTFVTRAVEAGYNTVALDDLAHLLRWDRYPSGLLAKIDRYRVLYTRLFAVATEAGLRVLINSDVMFYCDALQEEFQGSPSRAIAWLGPRLEVFFREFPQVAGIVFRIGESDALGTPGDFVSRLTLRTPAQARQFIEELLPVFEAQERALIFRTWTIGAHAIGDLMWHRRTFQKVFGGLKSGHLYVSMKYGESDFFRYLPLNSHFFRTPLKLIIELQTRREYEGFGEYPSFVGWEYENYLRQLAPLPNLAGASMWCQTGGWGRFRRLTYLEDSSVWTELNTHVAAGLCRGMNCEEAVEDFRRRHLPEADSAGLTAFLSLSDEVIRELLYLREFSQQKLFFRRLRVPPLLFVYWDRIFMNSLVCKALCIMVDNHELCVEEGYAGLRKLDQMRAMAARFGLPTQGLEFQRDTFEILALLREYVFGDNRQEVAARLKALKKAYRKKWKPRCYSLKFKPATPHRGLFFSRWIRRLLLRQQRGYRILDSIFTLRLLSLIYPLLGPWRKRTWPKFARKQAMGIDSVFR